MKKRNEKLEYYKYLTAGIEEYEFLKIRAENLSAVHLAVVLLKNKTKEQHRGIFKYLRAHNIGVQVHYTPIHLQPFYRKKGFREKYLPISEAYSQSAITIPLYPELTQVEQDYVVVTMNEAIKDAK